MIISSENKSKVSSIFLVFYSMIQIQLNVVIENFRLDNESDYFN